MSPVEFKKRSCRPVEFKGQGVVGWGWSMVSYWTSVFSRPSNTDSHKRDRLKPPFRKDPTF